ncbi:MAG: acetylglutamate kinase [Cyclobacteriaceae bacterium]
MSGEALYIVKIGGAVINDPEKLEAFLMSFAALSGKKLLVHGGGREASQLAETLGVKVKMIEGRRITDDNTIRIVTMVYGGLVNKRIVANLQAKGCSAIGLTGADGNLILSNKRPLKNGIDYGWVGDPIKVNDQLIQTLLEGDVTPIIAPLTHDGEGHVLNTNADTIANVIASSMVDHYDVNLVYAFELPGVMRDVNDSESVVNHIDPSKYTELKTSGVVVEGMIPKLDNAFEAINAGVKSVCIAHYTNIGKISDNSFDGYTRVTK